MRAFLLVFLLVFTTGVFAQSQPVQQPPPKPYNGRMTEATAGIVEYKMGRLGFAANDPRYVATSGAIWGSVGSVATYVGSALVIGGVAAVSWPAVLTVAVIGGVVGGAISLAQNGATTWLFGDNSVQSSSGGGVNPVDPNLGPNECWGLGGFGSFCHRNFNGLIAWADQTHMSNHGAGQTSGHLIELRDGYYVLGLYRTVDGKWQGDYFVVKNGKTAFNDPDTLPSTVVTGRPMEVANQIPAGDLDLPLSDQMLATAANAMWKKATELYPDALPWSPSNPITVADVAAWRAANPRLQPVTVRDYVSAIAPPGATTVPRTGANPNPGVAPTPGTGQQVDLGPDPNVGAPGLERIPTAEEIMAPGFSLMPDLRNFVMPSQAGECPKPEFDVFDKTYSMQAHCDLFEQNRSILQLAMVSLYSLLAIVIVLRA